MAKKRTAAKIPNLHGTIHGLKHAVWPHEGNDFHPHLIRPFGLFLVIVASYCLPLLAALPPQPAVKAESTSITQQELLKSTNAERRAHNVSSLNLSTDLTKAATLKAHDMLVHKYWAHNGPDGTTPWHWFQVVDYHYDFAGENLARGFTSGENVVGAWMQSPGHRENMLSSNYQEVGFAAVNGMLDSENTTLVVALYGSPQNDGLFIGHQAVLSAAEGNLSPLVSFSLGLQNMKPALFGSVVILLAACTVALLAHIYRKKLPKLAQKSWKQHHGFYKALGLVGLVILLISLNTSGSL